MTELEFDTAISDLEGEFLKRRKEIVKNYATQNNSLVVGDVVGDHSGKIQIELIKIYDSRPYPSCVYYGPILNKDGKRNKRNEKRNVYQSNIES